MATKREMEALTEEVRAAMIQGVALGYVDVKIIDGEEAFAITPKGEKYVEALLERLKNEEKK